MKEVYFDDEHMLGVWVNFYLPCPTFLSFNVIRCVTFQMIVAIAQMRKIVFAVASLKGATLRLACVIGSMCIKIKVTTLIGHVHEEAPLHMTQDLVLIIQKVGSS